MSFEQLDTEMDVTETEFIPIVMEKKCELHDTYCRKRKFEEY